MSERSASKTKISSESAEFESTRKVATMSNKTYRADGTRASNGGEMSGFQKLVKSTSGEYSLQNDDDDDVGMDDNDNGDDYDDDDDDKTPRGTEEEKGSFTN